MKPNPISRGLSKRVKKARFEWFDRSRGMPMITKVILMAGFAVIVLVINFDQAMWYVLGGVVVLFVLSQIPQWFRDWRYKRQCNESNKNHHDEVWRLK